MNERRIVASSRLFPLPIEGVYLEIKSSLNRHYFLTEGVSYKLTIPLYKQSMDIVKIFADTSYLALCKIGYYDGNYTLCHIKNGKILQESKQFSLVGGFSFSDFIDRKQYQVLHQQSRILIFSDFNILQGSMKTDTLKINCKAKNFRATDTYYCTTTEAGAIEAYDKKNLRLFLTLKGNFIANGIYIDSEGNYWVSTSDKGLLLFKHQPISNIDFPLEYKNMAYMSVTKTKDGNLYAGNFVGEVLQLNNNRMQIGKLESLSPTKSWVRSIKQSQNKLFVFPDTAAFIYLNKRRKQNKKVRVLKGYYIITGVTDNYQIFKTRDIKCLMIIKERTELMSELNKGDRVTNITWIDKKEIIYFSSINSRFKFSLLKDTVFLISATDTILNDSIVSVCTSSENLLWIATANNGVLVLNDDKLIAHVTKSKGLLSNTLNTITAGKNGQIWVGSNEGISIIYYSLKDSITVNRIQNLTIQDGLTSNVINQMCFESDTMYAATSRGISVIPANISIPAFDIPIRLLDVQVNQKDTLLLTHYVLSPRQNSINLQFAGVELTGHFKNAQLSMDKGETWTDLKSNYLSLQLSSGEHPVWLRAIDVNGNKGAKILKLQFDIDTPYYKAWWFWLPISTHLLATSFYIYIQWTKRKHQQKINEFLHQKELDELEIQALKAQINPHFVFNCLNSVRGFIYDEDFENADIYMQKFSQILRSTLKFSSEPSITLEAELEFIDTYLMLEKLRFGNKFEYSINTEEGLPLKDLMIPAMLLQPFVENAINHGVDHLVNRVGKILIKL